MLTESFQQETYNYKAQKYRCFIINNFFFNFENSLLMFSTFLLLTSASSDGRAVVKVTAKQPKSKKQTNLFILERKRILELKFFDDISLQF